MHRPFAIHLYRHYFFNFSIFKPHTQRERFVLCNVCMYHRRITPLSRIHYFLCSCCFVLLFLIFAPLSRSLASLLHIFVCVWHKNTNWISIYLCARVYLYLYLCLCIDFCSKQIEWLTCVACSFGEFNAIQSIYIYIWMCVCVCFSSVFRCCCYYLCCLKILASTHDEFEKWIFQSIWNRMNMIDA